MKQTPWYCLDGSIFDSHSEEIGSYVQLGHRLSRPRILWFQLGDLLT